jgi:hypothetical protein
VVSFFTVSAATAGAAGLNALIQPLRKMSTATLELTTASPPGLPVLPVLPSVITLPVNSRQLVGMSGLPPAIEPVLWPRMTPPSQIT